MLPHSPRGRSDGAQGQDGWWWWWAHKGKPPALWPSQWVAVRAVLQVLLPESAQRTAATTSRSARMVTLIPVTLAWLATGAGGAPAAPSPHPPRAWRR